MTAPRIVSVSQLTAAMETTLRAHLTATVAAASLQLDPVREWQQLPAREALSTAKFPAIAITSPGLTEPPTYSRAENAWRARWRLGVGIYDRGKDHAVTQRQVRDWCAAIRLTVRAHRSLGGVALGTTWAGEEYALLPDRTQARTIGGGAVAFDVDAYVIDTLGDLPLVATADTSVSVQ